MEYKIVIDKSKFEALLVKYPVASLEARASRITEALLMMEREIKLKMPVGAGPIHMRDTIFHRTNFYGENVWGEVGTPVGYGEPVELGTRPHFPPVAPIQFWVERKLGYGEKEAKSIAFLIARAISRRGTQAQRPFGKSVDARYADIINILNKIPDDIIRRLGQ